MKFLSLLKNKDVRSSSSSSWAWPSCHQPRTLSFRVDNDVVFKTINSADSNAAATATVEVLESPEPEDWRGGAEPPIETVIRGLRSDRLFFEPDETSSILEANKPSSGTFLLPYKNSVALSMDSRDPYVDFRKSMEEMVVTHRVNDWEGFEELLSWYLKVNEKSNHGHIVGAFVDLLAGLAPPSTSSPSPSNSPLSFYTSSLPSSSSTPCASFLEEVDAPPISPLLLKQVKGKFPRDDGASSSSSNPTP